MPKTANKRRKSKASSPISDTIGKLKKVVRKKVTRGQALSKDGKHNELEARAIQIKIAELEKQAEKAASDKHRTSSARSQNVRRQAQALKLKLES